LKHPPERYKKILQTQRIFLRDEKLVMVRSKDAGVSRNKVYDPVRTLLWVDGKR
jgi:hypothetical protein